MALWDKISKHFGKQSEKKEPEKQERAYQKPTKPNISSDLAVPWEQKLPPEKRRFDVRRICGGPGKSGMGIVYLAYDRMIANSNNPMPSKPFRISISPRRRPWIASKKRPKSGSNRGNTRTKLKNGFASLKG